jgi:DNA-directed RNA polymerase subunit H
VSVEKKKEMVITNHIYQPRHEIIGRKEAEDVLRKYNAKPSQLPYILIEDKGLEGLEVRPGDIIKITRQSPTAGQSVYYRYVVES